ncbi:hypothetical protein Rhal01_00982 [Rubritalea halochordaticola]|uniref:Lipocalin-like domain-containing protein n=1 Tax=Rubritalea halochordaticola TaxID=714537 RepID=A0ABP9UX68_9BACT
MTGCDEYLESYDHDELVDVEWQSTEDSRVTLLFDGKYCSYKNIPVSPEDHNKASTGRSSYLLLEGGPRDNAYIVVMDFNNYIYIRKSGSEVCLDLITESDEGHIRQYIEFKRVD